MPRAKVKPGMKYRVVSPDGGLGHIVLEDVTLNVSQEELDAFPDKLEFLSVDSLEKSSFRTILPEAEEPILIDEGDGPVKFTIAAYAAAEEAGVDINDVTGTGSDGRITKADVDKYVSEG